MLQILCHFIERTRASQEFGILGPPCPYQELSKPPRIRATRYHWLQLVHLETLTQDLTHTKPELHLPSAFTVHTSPPSFGIKENYLVFKIICSERQTQVNFKVAVIAVCAGILGLAATPAFKGKKPFKGTEPAVLFAW